MLFTFPSRYWFTIGHLVVFSLARWCWRIHAEFHRLRTTQDTDLPTQTSRTGLSPPMVQLSNCLPVVIIDGLCLSYNPANAVTIAVWANPCSLAATWGIPNWSLFLPVLRCFSSRSSPLLRDNRRSGWVAPFGHPWIIGCLRLPTAFRSLPRPSSPPSAKASTRIPLITFSSYKTLFTRLYYIPFH